MALYTSIEQVSWSQILLSKFPSFNPAWPDDVKIKWFDAFGTLMAMNPDAKVNQTEEGGR